LRENGQIGEFLIATPDAGRSFYINSKNGRERYEDFFIREFIPAIEQRYRALGTRAGRGISGTSMGGYGALRFAFRYPNLFASVSAHMPALMEEISGALKSALGPGLNAFGVPLDGRFWKQNTPFTLARHGVGLQNLRIYFDCGQQDDYGFEVGSQALHELLLKLGIPHEFHLYPGGHNGQFVAAHFPASLRFQSRALTAKR
jgi:S-formylglutathione hydrolase FrmB